MQVARKLMGHVEGCRSAFLTAVLRDRKIRDVATAELKQLVDELDAAAEAKASELKAFLDRIEAAA